MKRISVILATWLAILPTASAKISLPALWSSDMVLQQRSDMELRGTTDRSRTVKVWTSWDRKTVAAKPASDGSWSVVIHTPEAGGPYQIRISDGDVLTLDNLLVATIDIGTPNSIHPVNKKTVGERLAVYALGQTYGIKGFGYASPAYRSMEIAGSKIYINLDNAGNGACPMWTSLKGFEIAGEDRIFHPAFAEVETSTCRLAVSSPDVPAPVAVRYAYKNVPEYSVYNIYGLPLSPFRTDDWPL